MAFTTASKTGSQYLHTGRGPLDAKALVATYAELINKDTWTENGSIIAYNGMITAVWCNTADTSKNGIYFLHDSAVTTKFAKPNVELEANWHKLGGINDLPGLTEQIAIIQAELAGIKGTVQALQDSATEVVEKFSDLPAEGVAKKLYVVAEDTATYVWHDGNYLLVGDDHPDIQVIMGGGPNS